MIAWYHYQKTTACYGLATISRLLEITGLLCRISSLLYGSFAEETYDFQEPTNHSHPISCWQHDARAYMMRWPHTYGVATISRLLLCVWFTLHYTCVRPQCDFFILQRRAVTPSTQWYLFSILICFFHVKTDKFSTSIWGGSSRFTTQAMTWSGSFRTFIVHGPWTGSKTVRIWLKIEQNTLCWQPEMEIPPFY